MQGGLGKAGVSALWWSMIFSATRFGLQLVSQIILARVLGPESYGIFGVGMVMLTLSAFLTNFGFAWGLLNNPNATAEDIRFAFTWQVIVGGVTATLFWFSSNAVAGFYKEPLVAPVIRWLSLLCVLNASSAVSNNLLQHALNFRAVGIVQVSSYAVGYLCFGIPLAFSGYGVKPALFSHEGQGDNGASIALRQTEK